MVTFCHNNICPLRKKCYRYTSEDLDLHSPYDVFLFNDDGTCDFYMPLPYYFQITLLEENNINFDKLDSL